MRSWACPAAQAAAAPPDPCAETQSPEKTHRLGHLRRNPDVSASVDVLNVPSAPDVATKAPKNRAHEKPDILCQRKERAVEMKLVHRWAQDESPDQWPAAVTVREYRYARPPISVAEWKQAGEDVRTRTSRSPRPQTATTKCKVTRSDDPLSAIRTGYRSPGTCPFRSPGARR